MSQQAELSPAELARDLVLRYGTLAVPVVAVLKRCRANRLADAPRSSATRSTPGLQVEVSTVGKANAASSASSG